MLNAFRFWAMQISVMYSVQHLSKNTDAANSADADEANATTHVRAHPCLLDMLGKPLSKHLKGQLGPPVSNVTFLDQGQLGSPGE